MSHVKPIESDIELFAKAYFNIRLTGYQLDIIRGVATGRTVRSGLRAGRSTAIKVWQAYILAGLDPHGRTRLPKHHLPTRGAKMKGATQEGKVLSLIKRQGGAYNFELSRVALKYTSVISALRKEGHNIIAERQYLKNGRASNTYLYRLGTQ